MNTVLIIGSNNFFTKNLINKYYKEKWRIYTLVNNKVYIKPSYVFEQYAFDYCSDSIKEIIKSCRPDVVIFTGAYDTVYNWKNENFKNTALKYTSDLSNILFSVATQGIRHFIYLSSENVFEDEYIVDINEEMPVSPNTYRGMLISQGENMTSHFGQTKQMEVTIIRLANMYGIPTNLKESTDVISKMCVDALVSGRLQVDAKKIFSALFVGDAVEAIYILSKAPERKYNLYHVSSLEEITEDKIAQLIKDNYSHQVDIIDETMGLKKRIVLSNERLISEFSFDIRNSYSETIPKIISYINKHKKHFLESNEAFDGTSNKHYLFNIIKKAVPFLECIALFIPVFMLSHGIIESRYFEGINFYLLYVLLFAIVYGRQLAVFAALNTVIGYILSYILTTSETALIINTNIYIQIVQIFIVGLSVGHLKDKLIDISKEKNEEVDFLKEQLKDITVINSSNENIKDYYTDKVMGSTESIGRIYDITSRLQESEKGEVLFAALDTLKEIMETEEASIYLVSDNKHCRLATASGEKATTMGKSINMNTYPVIFDVLRSNQIFINRTLDTTLPMMASALYDDEKSIRIVIFLWNLPYKKMTLYYSNLLKIIGSLVYSVFVRDANYLDALAYKRYIPETVILQNEAFEEMVDIYKRAGEKGYSESVVLYIIKGDMSINELNDKIFFLLRETDYIGMISNEELAILLTNSGKNESEHVRQRLEKEDVKTVFGYII